MGPIETMRRKMDVLRAHCAAVGRNPATIVKTTALKPVIRDSVGEAERVWRAQMAHNQTPMANVERDITFVNGPAEMVADYLIARKQIGFTEAIAELAAPYDDETIERFIGEVKPLVDAA